MIPVTEDRAVVFYPGGTWEWLATDCCPHPLLAGCDHDDEPVSRPVGAAR